jgi:hypothetical protein
VVTLRSCNAPRVTARSFVATLTVRLIAADHEQASRSAHDLAETIGADVKTVKDVSPARSG